MKSVNGDQQHHYYPPAGGSSSAAAASSSHPNSHSIHQSLIHSPNMPHYGLGGGYVQTPPSPPTQQSGGPHLGNSALLPTSPSHHMSHGLMSRLNYTNNQSPSGAGPPPGPPSLYSSSRAFEEKSLTREAMEKYMRERNDMVIVILHAKVRSSSILYMS